MNRGQGRGATLSSMHSHRAPFPQPREQQTPGRSCSLPASARCRHSPTPGIRHVPHASQGKPPLRDRWQAAPGDTPPRYPHRRRDFPCRVRRPCVRLAQFLGELDRWFMISETSVCSLRLFLACFSCVFHVSLSFLSHSQLDVVHCGERTGHENVVREERS
jgi:hypothetical protein